MRDVDARRVSWVGRGESARFGGVGWWCVVGE